MKAISVRQPWAYLIENAKKSIETRTNKWGYKGPLVICSSKSKPDPELCAQFDLDPDSLPLGQALCVVEKIDDRPMTKDDESAACCDIYPRARAWVFKNVRKIEPFPISGSLGSFEVDLNRKCRA